MTKNFLIEKNQHPLFVLNLTHQTQFQIRRIEFAKVQMPVYPVGSLVRHRDFPISIYWTVIRSVPLIGNGTHLIRSEVNSQRQYQVIRADFEDLILLVETNDQEGVFQIDWKL